MPYRQVYVELDRGTEAIADWNADNRRVRAGRGFSLVELKGMLAEELLVNTI